MSHVPKLLSYYNNKINIYNNDNFIPLPTWRSCPAPPMQFIIPGVFSQIPCAPPEMVPMQPPVYPAGGCYLNVNNNTTNTSVPSNKTCSSC